MEHVRLGSYRRDRHGPLPSDPLPRGNVLPLPLPPATWEPTAADLDALQPAGRAFVDGMLARYSFALNEAVLLLEAGHCLDRLSVLRAAAEPAVRNEVALSRLLASLIGQLRVDAP